MREKEKTDEKKTRRTKYIKTKGDAVCMLHSAVMSSTVYQDPKKRYKQCQCVRYITEYIVLQRHPLMGGCLRGEADLHVDAGSPFQLFGWSV